MLHASTRSGGSFDGIADASAIARFGAPLSSISESVLVFLKEHMTSFECLEVLLFLHRRSPASATCRSISERTGIAEDLVLDTLQTLRGSKLVSPGSTPGDFRYEPATAELATTVDALNVAYREQGAAVLSTMSINAIERIRSGSLRAFADAFVLRKDDKNG